jgi:hypothetical protein
MYIDRDEQNNIVSIFSRPQRKDHEFIEVEALKAELQLQEFQWEHGYD